MIIALPSPRAKDWTILEGGFGATPADAKVFKEFRSALGKSGGKPLLDAEVNFPLLGALWTLLGPPLPSVHLVVSPRKDGLRSEAQIDYPQPMGITLRTLETAIRVNP